MALIFKRLLGKPLGGIPYEKTVVGVDSSVCYFLQPVSVIASAMLGFRGLYPTYRKTV